MRQQNLLRLLIIVATIFIFVLPTARASAKSTLEVEVDFPITDKLKYDTASPAVLTIKNNGEDFSGDIVISTDKNNYTATTAESVDIASGEEKQLHIELGGAMIAQDPKDALPKIIKFYADGIENGKKVNASYKLVKTPQLYPDDTPFIFTLTSNPDRLQALSNQLKKETTEFVQVPLTKEIFPSYANGLALATTIMIDDVAVADLTAAQQDALLAWVKQGGAIIVGTTANSLGALDAYLPLTKGAKQQLALTKELSVPGYLTTIQPNATVSSTTAQGETLAAKQVLGKGSVTQVAFALGDQPYNSNKQYGEWLVTNLAFGYTTAASGQHMVSEYYKNGSATFDALNISASGILLAIILYVVIVGPILYVVLKKIDKREYAWVIIPTLAVVVAVVLFGFGAKDRLAKPQTQQVATYIINEDSSLSGTYLTSLLTNRSGKFAFTFDDTTTASAIEATNFGTSVQQSYTKDQQVVFKDARYWSIQQVQGDSFIPKLGKFDTALVVSNGRVEGTIKSNFPFEMKDVAISTGIDRIPLGTIKPGETVQVSEAIPNQFLQSAEVTMDAYQLTSNATGQNITETLHQAISEAAVAQVQELQTPVIIAWTDEPLVGLTYDGKAKQQTLNYVAQPFTAGLELQGDFTITGDVLPKKVYDEQSNQLYTAPRQGDDEWYFEGTHTIVELQVPEQMLKDIASIKQIAVQDDGSAANVLIWNTATKRYEEIASMPKNASSTNYIEGNRIKLQLIAPEHQSYTLPTVELKGVAQ